MKYYFYLLTSFFIINSLIFSQTDSLKGKTLVYTFVQDGADIIIRPIEWNFEDWAKFSGVTVATYLAYQYTDKEISEFYSQRLDMKDKLFFQISKMYGEPLVTSLVAGGVALYSNYYKDEEAAQIAFEVIESFMYSLTINIALKTVIGRFRPYRFEGNNKFKLVNLRYGTTSFPSGHSTVAFSLSSVLASHTDNYFYKLLLFTPAFFTSWQRMVQNQHWSSDVISGAAIGYFVGTYLVSKHKKEKLLPLFFSYDGENIYGNFIYRF